MIREKPSWQLPPGILSDSLNIVFDVPGIARQRGPSTALVSGAQTAFGTSLGFVHSQNAGFTIEELYSLNGKTGNFNVINKVTGAATSLGSQAVGLNGAIIGRPVRHFGFLTFAWNDPAASFRQIATLAGQTSTTTFTNAVVAQTVALSPQVTLTGADVTTNVKVGATVLIVTATQQYWGRVVSIDTTKKFSVWPAPTFTDAAIPIGGVTLQPFYSTIGGAVVTSFQNRLLIANTNDLSASGSLVADRRVYYSPTPVESITLAGITNSGAVFLNPGVWGAKNWFEIPGADPIVAMEPVSDGQLLILTTTGVAIFSGTLATQTDTAASGVTWDIYTLPTLAGCLSDLSVQKTPIGIMWASTEGVFAYWPPLRRSPAHTGLRDVTEGSINVYWRSLTRGANFAIHGSAYVRNHYIITGTSGGTLFALAYNLTSGAWAPLAGVGTDLFLGALRPTDQSQCFALRWWDQTGAAPSMTNGQTLRLDSMFATDVAGQTKLDADGNVVAFTAKTRTMTDDQETERILRRVGFRYALDAPGANVTIAVGSRLDALDAAGTPTVALGSLSNTAVLTISGQSNASPIVITTSTNHGLQTEDQVDIRGATPNTAANGRWRITVLSPTTFSLNSSTGNGATSATGTVKKISEQEFAASAADIGQGNYLALASSGTVNRFEMHGARLGALEIPRGMGR